MSQFSERRKEHDRRQREAGPPNGWRDRRKKAERRIPETAEYVVSEADWLRYFGHLPAQSAGNTKPSPAASALARVGDS